MGSSRGIFSLYLYVHNYQINNHPMIWYPLKQAKFILRIQLTSKTMKPIKLRPIVQKSPFKDYSHSLDQNAINSLIKTLGALSSEMKNLGTKFNNALSSGKESQRGHEYIKDGRQGHETSNQNRREPRFQDIQLQIPSRQIFSGPDRKFQIQQWLGMICKDVFSVGFDYFHNDHLSTQKLKAYCSQNLLRNIIRVAHESHFTPADFDIINNCLKNDLIPYFALKYPLTEESQATIRFAREIIEKNNIDDAQNDLVFRSGIKFRKNANGNYNEEIMRFFNYVIDLPNKSNKDLFKDINSSSNTLYDSFFEDMQSIFRMVESKQEVLKMKTFDPRNPQQKAEYVKEEETQKEIQEYEEKVKGYTSYLIGRKISENTRPFSEEKCQAGNLKLFNSQIIRIATKWCEQLLSNIKYDYLINKQQMFRMRNQNVRFLKPKELKIFAYILEYSNKIDQYIVEVMKNIYDSQSQFSKKKIPDDLRKYGSSQVIVGQFSSVMYSSNQNYLIGYLNNLINNILSGIEVFKKYLLIKDRNIEPLDRAVDNLLEGKGSVEEVVKKIEEEEVEGEKDVDYKIPQLITFKIGDLLRCKCSSKENEILALYKEIQRISFTNPDLLKIVRLKNRLQKGTKDILINLLYRNAVLIEIQLSIKTKQTKFTENSNKFAHYLYQLERAQFGPIAQLCNIWINLDNRSKFYLENFQKMNTRTFFKLKSSPKKECCDDRKNHKELTLPFKCDQCNCYYFDCNYIHSHNECQVCRKKTCVHCYFEQTDFTTLSQVIPELGFVSAQITEKFKQSELSQSNEKFTICSQIPQTGLLLNLKSKKVKTSYFYRLEYQNQIYLFQNVAVLHSDTLPKKPSIKLVARLEPSQSALSKFYNENVIFSNKNLSSLIQPISSEKAQLEYFIPQYLNKCLKNHATSINLMKKSMSQDIFLFLPKNTVFRSVQKINFHENCLTSMESLFQMFPNIEEAILHENQIVNIPNSIEKWQKNLKKLMIKKNGITSIDQNIGKMKQLTEIQMHMNGDLANLPKSIGNLKNLKSLWISNCNLEVVPEEIGDLANLQVLYLGGNRPLNKLPDSIGKLSKLESLAIDNTEITELPQNLQNLHNLKSLLGFACRLVKFPEKMAGLKNLKHINVFENQITKLPDQFGQLISLQSFTAHGNQIQQLPQSFGKLNKLKSLVLFSNQLVCLPSSFGGLTSLQQLVLEMNSLQELPDSFGQLKNLKTANFSENKLKTLPASFKQLKSLESLLCYTNEIEQFPEHLCEIVSLVSLGLDNNKIKSISKSIGFLSKLKYLSFGMNNISCLPDEIGKCTELVSLSCSNNKITEITAQIFKLGKLQKLIVSHNTITTIYHPSSEYLRISRIQKIDISHNNLTVFPTFLSELPKLSELIISNNQIQNIPDCISTMRSLCLLQMQNNRLKSIGNGLGSLLKLEKASFSQNLISEIPQNVLSSQSLKILILQSNKIKAVPPQIAQMPKLSYLNLAANQISTLPALPPSLAKISLDRNQLKQFPKALLDLKLTRMVVNDNQFTQLPGEFQKLGQSMIFMKLDENKLNEESHEIIKKVRTRMMYNR